MPTNEVAFLTMEIEKWRMEFVRLQKHKERDKEKAQCQHRFVQKKEPAEGFSSRC
jgi:hypothetical protein